MHQTHTTISFVCWLCVIIVLQIIEWAFDVVNVFRAQPINSDRLWVYIIVVRRLLGPCSSCSVANMGNRQTSTGKCFRFKLQLRKCLSNSAFHPQRDSTSAHAPGQSASCIIRCRMRAPILPCVE